jgi:hypothetical protein
MECTFQMTATTDWSKNLRVEVRGDDAVGYAGNVIPRMLADAAGHPCPRVPGLALSHRVNLPLRNPTSYQPR